MVVLHLQSLLGDTAANVLDSHALVRTLAGQTKPEEKNLAGTAEPLKISLSPPSLVGERSPSHLDDSLHDRKCPL